MLGNTELREYLPDLIEAAPLAELAIRPASVDLSVGRIFVPPEDGIRPPEITTSYVVPVGGTLIVETRESLNVSADYAGLMFPKSSALAEKGILITNFGCVDPGYRGHLKFVIINLGRRPFGIREGDRVVTLTLFRLSTAASPDYQEYSKGRPPQLSPEETSLLLSHDFVDVARRAAEEAKTTVQKSVLGLGIVLSLFIVVPSILMSLLPPLLEGWTSFGREDSRLDSMEAGLSKSDVRFSQEIAELRIEIDSLKAK